MDSNLVSIQREVLRWPGVTPAPGRFGAVAFRYGKREIGHIHRDRVADLPVTREMREGLLSGGRARPHQAGVKSYISYPVQDQEDVSWCSRSWAGTTTARKLPSSAAPRGIKGRRAHHERLYTGGDRVPPEPAVSDYGRELEFGTSVEPLSDPPDWAARVAQAADRAGLDLVGIQDHPYQRRFLDTWTLISTLVPITERVRFFPDVANLPLRPPSVLAKAAASLDVLSGGRVEMGLGA